MTRNRKRFWGAIWSLKTGENKVQLFDAPNSPFNRLGTDGAPAWLGKRIVTDSPAGIIQTAIPCRKEKTKAGLEALVFLVYRERAGEGTLATGTLYVRYI